MSALFSSPKSPPVTPPPPVPRRNDAETQSLAAEQRRKFLSNQGGRSATMLTGATGFTQGFSTGTAKLLGQTASY